MNIFTRSNVPELFDIVPTLDQLANLSADQRMDDVGTNTEAELAESVRKMMHRHILPPTVLGQGKTQHGGNQVCQSIAFTLAYYGTI